MRRTLLPITVALLMLSAAPAMAQATAEVKIGTAVEKAELQGAAESFKVAAGTKLYAWTKVTGSEGAKITIVFLKADKEVSKVELEVPRSPYRTNAYRTFRAGDGGAWAASVRSADGKELGKAAFTVEVN
jgi:hypothetical protein